MTINPFQKLICPIDAAPLTINDKSWSCANGHCFDIAKQGYSNLLPVQNKRSLDPGDHKEMVACRQRFLNTGYYQPIADAVTKAVLLNFSNNSNISCLDAGCGEGYYLRQLASANTQQSLSLVGIDISKWAVLAAAKQDKNVNWIVASNANLPVESASLDCVLCMFGFPVYSEFHRVLITGGLLIQVDTGVEHLKELREIIYPTLKPERIAKTESPEGFNHLTTDSVCYSLNLQGAEQIADLLAMTPHFYRASTEGKTKAAALTELTLTIDVKLKVFESQ